MTHEPFISVTLLAEANASRGLGHVARCCALYDALAELSAVPSIVVRGEAPRALLGDRTWRTAEWAPPDDVAAQLTNADAAVVDSYEAQTATYVAIAAAVSTAAFFDDTGRLVYPRGLVVNGSPAVNRWDYPKTADSELLLGLQFQPLRREFWDVPSRGAARRTLQRVLVVFGGTDARGLRKSIVQALTVARPELTLDVVDTPRSAEQMRRAMLDADVAISAGGQTLYELVRTGTPSVAVCMAENQMRQSRAWCKLGAAVLAGTWDDPGLAESVSRHLFALNEPGVRNRMSKVGPALVDGRGALRVARAVLGRVLDERTRLLPATAGDAGEVLDLANDPVVRANSMSTEPIPLETHSAWLVDRMEHPDTAMTLLAWDAGTLAGQVRFDRAGDEAEISISIAGPFRGLGWSPLLLRRALRIVDEAWPGCTTLVARVRAENVASQRLFKRAGFVLTDPTAGSFESTSPQALVYRRTTPPE